MGELKPLICERCGGHINRRTMRCPYCETQYNGKLEVIPDTPPFSHNGVETLAISIQIPEEDFCRGADASLNVRKKMCEALAKSMMPYLEVREIQNPISFDWIFTGLVKFVKP